MADYANTPGSDFADPGFQPDKKKRYRLDTADKVRAAWSYINMPRNSSKYTSTQLSHIKSKIKAAAKKDGIEISDKATSSIQTADFTSVTPKVNPPDSTSSHFFTAGRMITYGEPNLNGLVFFKEDCSPVIDTLRHSLADIAHVKPGNGVPAIHGENNATIGSIYEVHEDDEGIDIICKNDRSCTEGMGFSEEDFKPIDGIYSSFSQESDFTPSSSPVIAVKANKLHNINPEKDIVYEIHPEEAKRRGLSTSSYNSSTGKWTYNSDPEGNILFIRLRPLSFSGVGHVITPADEKAQIYTYAACIEGEKTIASIYPRTKSDLPSMDDPGYIPPYPGISAGDTPFDTGAATNDFINHPDLSSASVDYHGNDGDDNPDYGDDAFAVDYYDNSSYDPTQPAVDQEPFEKKRAFRIKDKNGNFDRKRLIAAYHAITGMRGATHITSRLPQSVAAHALAVVRQGLEQTKSKEKNMSEYNNNPALDADIATLQERAKALSSEKEKATAAYENLSKEFSDYKSAQTELAATHTSEIEAFKGQIKEYADKALSSTRLAALEAVLPYSEEEKTAETFEEFVKSLASFSEEKIDNLILRRELQKAKSDAEVQSKALSSLNGGIRLSPVPQFTGEGSPDKPSMTDLL